MAISSNCLEQASIACIEMDYTNPIPVGQLKPMDRTTFYCAMVLRMNFHAQNVVGQPIRANAHDLAHGPNQNRISPALGTNSFSARNRLQLRVDAQADLL